MSLVLVEVGRLAAHGIRMGSADVAQLVEHSLGKGEVISSILIIGSRNRGFTVELGGSKGRA
jgi:hypothetical protein